MSENLPVCAHTGDVIRLNGRAYPRVQHTAAGPDVCLLCVVEGAIRHDPAALETLGAVAQWHQQDARLWRLRAERTLRLAERLEAGEPVSDEEIEDESALIAKEMALVMAAELWESEHNPNDARDQPEATP